MMHVVYLAIGLSGLVTLAAVLVHVGRLAADCPQLGPAARLSTTVITTGFLALGVGAIGLVGALLPNLFHAGPQGLYLAVGILAVALGLGFYQAASTLRDLMQEARLQTAVPREPDAAA